MRKPFSGQRSRSGSGQSTRDRGEDRKPRDARAAHADPATRPKRGMGGKPRVKPRGPAAPAHAAASRSAADALSGPMRIAKAIARAGLCSRREAERWIAEGRVSVNGQTLTTPAFEVQTHHKVLVDGRPLPMAEPVQVWRYHKPKGLVTSHADPQGRPTVFEKLPPELPRVISIGRLDFNTEGLLLLTNDGELARHLELPATGWLRRYRVRARGRVTPEQLAALKNGTEIDGIQYGAIEASIDTVQGANMWLTVGIREGKNREVRKVMQSLGLEVSRLMRISFGPFELGSLGPGAVEQVKRRQLAEHLGTDVAARFGLIETAEARRQRHKGGQAGKKTGGDDGE